MQQAPSLEPVWAVILVRDSFEAQEARVLLGNDEYFTYPGPRNTERDILVVAHLAVAAKARVEEEFKTLEFGGPVVVYDFNPTVRELKDLKLNTEGAFSVDLTGLEISGAEDIADDRRGRSGGHNPYFVLVTAQQWPTPMEVAAAGRLTKAKGLAQAEKRISMSDDERFQSIQGKVEKAVQAAQLRLPQVFRLPDDHRFSAKVNARNIPRYPGISSRPYLLMEGLAPQLLDGDNIIDVEPIRLIPDQEKENLRRQMERPVVLLGVSGAGKTQMLCEMLAEEYGLLFVADCGSNGGCQDFEDAVTNLNDILKKDAEDASQDDLNRLSDASDGPQEILEQNLMFARHHFQAVVLARLLILQSLLKHYPEQMCPALWIWIQQYPSHVFESKEEQLVSLFRTLWLKCRELTGAFLKVACVNVTEDIRGGPGIIPAFVDEAQTLLQQLTRGFPSSSDRTLRRSCFSAVVKSLNEVCRGPLMAGTGIRMAAATEEITTAMGGKPGASLDEIRALRRTHLTPEECKKYILKYLDGIEPEDLDTICQTLQGRPRFTERFVSSCIEHCGSKTAWRIFEEYVEIQVTGESMTGEDRARLVKLSFFWSIAAIHSRLSASGNTRARQARDLVSAFKSLALRYAITGQEQISDEAHLKLIEYGMGNIRRVDGKLAVSICEPLVVRAACFFFGLADYQAHRLRENLGNRSALGNEMEAYVALTLFNERKPLHLAIDSVLNLEGVEIPEAFRGEWKLYYPKQAVTTGVLGCDSKQEEDLENFFGSDPAFAFLFPDAYAGSDVFNRACDVQDLKRRIFVSIQIKLRDEVADLAGAIKSTSVDCMFTHADGSEVQTRSDHRHRVLAAREGNRLPVLRIVVAYPAILNQPTVECISDEEIVLTIDRRTMHRVFDEGFLGQLDELRRTPERKRGVPTEADANPRPQKRSQTTPSKRRRRSSRVLARLESK